MSDQTVRILFRRYTVILYRLATKKIVHIIIIINVRRLFDFFLNVVLHYIVMIFCYLSIPCNINIMNRLTLM